MRWTLLALFLLAACGRPLTEAEQVFMAELAGPAFDPAPVRITQNPLIGLTTRSYPARPRSTCRERIFPPPQGDTATGRTAGIVFFNRLHLREDYALPDYIAREDGAVNLLAQMFFVHEMTHIWQWQNRARTGYHPARAFAEHARLEDPYLFEAEAELPFLDYGYEQQASLVEEYVCCRTLDPEGARTQRLERLISQAMDLSPISQQPRAQSDILLPWSGVELAGICS